MNTEDYASWVYGRFGQPGVPGVAVRIPWPETAAVPAGWSRASHRLIARTLDGTALDSDPTPGANASVNQFDVDVNTVVAEASELLIRKHHDYGPKNISLSPGGALNGLRVRLFDKTARLNNLVDKDVDPKNESLRDTLIDIANYAVIGIMVLDGRWPE